MRPIYLIVVLWGERYRRYFTDWCLPSLLAQGNIPSLEGPFNKLVVVCPDEDWQAMQDAPSMQLAATYLGLLHLTIPVPDPNLNPCKVMGVGHKLSSLVAFEAKAFGVQLTPDCMLSDGLLSTVQRHAKNGTKVLLILALRYAEEPMLMAMHAKWKHIGQLPLSITARDMAAIGMASMHPETKSYQWGTPYFARFPASVWQPVEDGMVCMGLSWAPFLFDYGALSHLNTLALETWTMDGDYVYRNFGDHDIHHITDTDDGVVVSWTPLKPTDRVLTAAEAVTVPITDGMRKSFGKVYNHGVFDPLKRKLFWEPVLWHPGSLTPAYHEKATAMKDEMGWVLGFDWRRMGYINTDGEIIATLDETLDEYETRRRR